MEQTDLNLPIFLRDGGHCEFHGNCRRVCPKDVPPLIAIAKAREQLNNRKRRKRRNHEICGLEKDSLGEKEIPIRAYYGIQTLRAVENFPVSGRTERTEFIKAYVTVKKAAALTNMELGFP